MLCIDLIDPFVMQLVIVPFITIGCGLLVGLFYGKILVAPLVTFIVNATYEIYYCIHYGLPIGITSCWNIYFPMISFIITFIVFDLKKG